LKSSNNQYIVYPEHLEQGLCYGI